MPLFQNFSSSHSMILSDSKIVGRRAENGRQRGNREKKAGNNSSPNNHSLRKPKLRRVAGQLKKASKKTKGSDQKGKGKERMFPENGKGKKSQPIPLLQLFRPKPVSERKKITRVSDAGRYPGVLEEER